ncbi:MAG TPA: IS5 family transposase [Waddliaceae bacterium]
MSKPRGLFDEQIRLEKISKQKDPLERLSSYIDFDYFRKPLRKYFDKQVDRSKGGRPGYDYVLMFKILILQRYYNLSDDSIEYAILDRLSFMRFLGLGINDPVPDAKTIWLFRDKLTQGGMIEKLFGQLDKQLDKDGIIVHAGKIVDASIVEVPVQRNSREENKDIKEGQVPEEWEENENKLRQKDTDARWVTHNGIDYFGYKDHIKADEKTLLITGYQVTTAKVHDSEAIEGLLNKNEDGGQPLHADSAYRSERIEKMLRKKNIISCVQEKGYRGRPLTARQRQRNRKKSRIRARIEHVFAFMTNSMNEIYLHYRSLKRVATGIGLMNLTYNLFRLVQLKVALSK